MKDAVSQFSLVKIPMKPPHTIDNTSQRYSKSHNINHIRERSKAASAELMDRNKILTGLDKWRDICISLLNKKCQLVCVKLTSIWPNPPKFTYAYTNLAESENSN